MIGCTPPFVDKSMLRRLARQMHSDTQADNDNMRRCQLDYALGIKKGQPLSWGDL